MEFCVSLSEEVGRRRWWTRSGVPEGEPRDVTDRVGRGRRTRGLGVGTSQVGWDGDVGREDWE